LYRKLKCGSVRGDAAKPFRLPDFELTLVCAVGLLFAAVAFVAVECPPNTWDAMEYHMPRLVHWLQNHSVSFYATNETKQLYMPPWSEYAMLQMHAVSGGDHLDNLVQWFAYAGCAIAASLIARELRAGLRGQVLAGMIAATIPEGILEASSPKNDVTVAFWLTAFVFYALVAIRSDRPLARCGAAATLGLACLTKGTAYVLGPPVFLAIAVALARQRKQVAVAAVVVFAGVSGLNAMQWVRSVRVYGSPTGPSALVPPKGFKVTNNKLSFSVVFSGVLRNTALHFGTPSANVNKRLDAGLKYLISLTGADPNDPDTTWDYTKFQLPDISLHEALAGNPLHTTLIVATMVILVSRWRSLTLRPALAVATGLATSYILFCAVFKWQPWNTRLHLALFVPWAAVIGTVLAERPLRLLQVIIPVTLLGLAVPPVLQNQLRPLMFAGDFNILNQPRDAMYFNDNRAILSSYTAAAAYAGSQNCTHIGLNMAVQRFMYPLYVLLHSENGETTVREIEISDPWSRRYATAEPQPCVIICPGCAGDHAKADLYRSRQMSIRYFGDVLVASSKPVSKSAANCSVAFSGWYDAEKFGADWSRWSDRTGRVLISLPEETDGVIDGQVVSLREPNIVDLRVNGIAMSTVNLTKHEYTPLREVLRFKAGDNVLEFVSRNPGARIATDPRTLAISLRDLTIKVTKGGPCLLSP
jgi:hypothetical protein